MFPVAEEEQFFFVPEDEVETDPRFTQDQPMLPLSDEVSAPPLSPTPAPSLTIEPLARETASKTDETILSWLLQLLALQHRRYSALSARHTASRHRSVAAHAAWCACATPRALRVRLRSFDDDSPSHPSLPASSFSQPTPAASRPPPCCSSPPSLSLTGISRRC